MSSSNEEAISLKDNKNFDTSQDRSKSKNTSSIDINDHDKKTTTYKKVKLLGLFNVSQENKTVILTMIGVVIGLSAGVLFRKFLSYEDDPYLARKKQFAHSLIKLLGELMMRAFTLIIIPLLATSVISGITALGASSGRVGKLAFGFYMCSTVCALVLGIILVNVIEPGKIDALKEGPVESLEEVEIANRTLVKLEPPRTAIQFIDIARNLLPNNIFYATIAVDRTEPHHQYENVEFSYSGENKPSVFIKKQNLGSPNLLGLVMISIIIAVIINNLNNQGKAKNIKILIDEMNDLVMYSISLIIYFVPVGVASLIAGCIYNMEGDLLAIFTKVGAYFFTVLFGIAIHIIITLPTAFYLITRKNPYKFIYGLKRALMTGFGTASSNASLPVNIECCESMGLDKRLTRFILPLGSTINMDGTALMQGVAAITIAQMEGKELTLAETVSLVITATLCSVGASGIPSAGLVMLTLILEGLGLDKKNIAMLWVFDWLLDRFRTVVNMAGDAIGCAVVAELERKSGSENSVVREKESEC